MENIIYESIFGIETTQLKFGKQSLNELSWEIKKQNSEIKEESNNVEELIKGTQNQNNKSNVSVESSSNLEESIIEKIKNN